MADAATTATTQVPASHEGAGFPPFKTETFPSQLFWLAITFGFLFVALWRVAGPRINGAIAGRRATINGAIAHATQARNEADAAAVAYQAALAQARAKAQSLIEQSRLALNAEIAKAKADADAEAAASIAAANTRIAAMHTAAKSHVAGAARDAAIVIVERLIGETVSPDEAAKAVES